MKILTILGMSLIGLAGFVNAASAQSLSLGIWPPLLEVMIQPGKSITQVYKISNPGESDVVLTSSIIPFVPADEQGNISFTSDPPTGEAGVSDWFSFQNADLQLGQNFVLRAGKEQEVVLRIGVPTDAPESDYYYTLLFETQDTPGVFLGRHSGSGGRLQAKIGANILLTISRSGEPVRQAKIKEFSLTNSQLSILNYQLMDSFDKPEFVLRLQNTGRSFFKPMGTITVNGWLGPPRLASGEAGQKYTLDLLPENVLAASTRQIICQKDSNPRLCVTSSKFLLGRYVTKLEFGLDEPSDKYQKEIIFWAIPAKLSLGALTSLLLLYIIKVKTKI